MKDLVNHPEHYNTEGRKECWDEMIDIFGYDAVAIFDALSAYKYNYRAGKKDDNPEVQDRNKIINYMNHAEKMLYNNVDRQANTFDLAYRTVRKMGEILDENN